MKATAKRWTRDELFIVLNAYHKLNFGQFHHRHPVIVALAEKLGRTANSVSMKLSNLASFDPVLKARGIKGLWKATKLDKDTWDEFHADFQKSAVESETKLRNLFDIPDKHEIEISRSKGIVISPSNVPISNILVEKTETVAEIRRRNGQNLFRDAVLNNYEERCAITHLNVRALLIASHILPWATHPTYRLDIENGICLSRLHDAAFDTGLIAFDDNLCLLISPVLRNALPKKIVEENFLTYEARPLHITANAIPPSVSHLAKHREFIFQRQ